MAVFSVKTILEKYKLLLFPLIGLFILGANTIWRSVRDFGIGLEHHRPDTILGHSKAKNMSTEVHSSLKDNSDRNERNSIKIMTWNLQGLLTDKLHDRTEAVITALKLHNPDAMFFQELIPSTFQQIFQALEQNYNGIQGSRSVYSGYFTGIFYNKKRFDLIDHEVIPFSNSVMDRTLLIVKLQHIGAQKIRMGLMTSHLESLPRFQKSRQEQLEQSFKMMNSLSPKYSVIFGGDLNLEADEEVGILPNEIKDLWEEHGSLEEHKYTWDMSKNTNERVPGLSVEEQPRRRYDRLYYRASVPTSIQLTSFHLSGKEIVPATSYYPSDHWALVSTFDFTV